MEFEFMTADTVLPPCMPLPAAMLRLPISSTAKVMYARLLDEILTDGVEDSNGILFIRFPIVDLAAANSSVVASIATAAEEQSATSEEINRAIHDYQALGEDPDG